MKASTLIIATVMLTMGTSCKNNNETKTVDDKHLQSETFYDSKAGNKANKVNEVNRTNKVNGENKANENNGVNQYEIPAPLKNRSEQILRRLGYTVSYNAQTRCPNWVAWHLTKSHTYGKNQRTEQQFTEDTDVAAPRATDDDYYNSRYDRGHLCPAGDNKWDPKAMSESFLFTNICPQNHGLNKYEWNDLEILCREWAREYGAIDIVCGPIYDKPVATGRQETAQQKTIGRNKVWVPTRLFKVVLCRKGAPKAIGFIYANEGRKQYMSEAVCTVDEVERITGIDFFPALDDQLENRIEAEARLSDWKR